jgi:diguanylate cyclase (GGDEF)-like protein/PAS domain S-box-containing protein
MYYASGIVVRPLILPPTYAAPIWPAAGIGVGVLIIWGYRYIPSILVGEILINFNFYEFDQFEEHPELIISYLCLLLATVVRSVVGVYLVKRQLGKSNNYLTLHSIAMLFVLAGVIPTFISSAISTYTLVYSGQLDVNSQVINFLTWWFGDSVGVFIVLPLMFLIFKKPRISWKPRLYRTAIPVLITFVFLVVIALNIKELEKKRIDESLSAKAATLFEKAVDLISSNGQNLHKISTADLISKLNHIFANELTYLINKNALDDVHFTVYSVEEKSKTKLFSSKISYGKLGRRTVSQRFNLSGHEWNVVASTSAKYYINNGSWLIWWLLSIGFLFTAFLGAGLLVVTGNTILIKDKVVERVKEIATLNKILIERDNRYKQIIDIQPVIFWSHIIGNDKLDYVSDEALNILGYKMEEMLDLDFIWGHIIYPDDRKKAFEQYYRGIKNQKRFEIKYRAICNDGRIVWFKDFISSQIINGQTEVVGLKIDFTKDQEKEQKISQLAFSDTMTKLPNRVRFMMYLKDAIEISKNNNTYGAVLFLDLDRFKVLNDSMGHYFGDKLLIQIGQRLKKLLKTPNIPSRFGGDEFVILVGQQEKTLSAIQKAAMHIAKEIQVLAKDPFNIDGHNFYTTFSTGISVFPYNSINPSEIIQQADIAMYSSKALGKNTISFFKDSMQQEANKLLQIEKSLKISLLRNEFEMYYQPIFNENKEILKFESLIRWNHPEEGLLTPHSFIHIAEETGFIVELSEWVIENVFNNVCQWQKNHQKKLSVSINISLFQFSNTQIVDVLDKVAKKYTIDTQNITLELTESIGIENFDDALIKLKSLKELGFKIAIDDFGSGYSSLNYLAQMPIDILKLDKSFVSKIGRDTNTETLIETIVLMSKQLNLDLIVEGVESEMQFAFLKDLGCDTFQGHLLSEALPFKHFADSFG